MNSINLSGKIESIKNTIMEKLSCDYVLEFDLDKNVPKAVLSEEQIIKLIFSVIKNSIQTAKQKKLSIKISTGSLEYGEEKRSSGRKDILHGKYVYLDVETSHIDSRDIQMQKLSTMVIDNSLENINFDNVIGIIERRNKMKKNKKENESKTRQRFIFPASEENNENSLQDGQTDSRTVLLVDDEEYLLEIAKKMIETFGHNVITATDGEEAVEIYNKCSKEIDLVILDLSLPNMDGAAAFKQIIKTNKNAVVLLSSGYSSEKITEKTDINGFSGFLQKPYTMEILDKKIKSALKK